MLSDIGGKIMSEGKTRNLINHIDTSLFTFLPTAVKARFFDEFCILSAGRLYENKSGNDLTFHIILCNLTKWIFMSFQGGIIYFVESYDKLFCNIHEYENIP